MIQIQFNWVHILPFIGFLLMVIGFSMHMTFEISKKEDTSSSMWIFALGLLLFSFPFIYAGMTFSSKTSDPVSEVRTDIEKKIGEEAASLKAEEVTGDLKDGYYVLPAGADMEKVKETLAQNEVLVYGSLPEKGGEIHFVTIRDSKALVDSEFKGEDAKYFEKEKQPERENLFSGQ